MKKNKNPLFKIFAGIFICAGLYLAYLIYSNYIVSANAYEDASKNAKVSIVKDEISLENTVKDNTVTENIQKYETEEIISLNVDFSTQSSSVIGWIQVENNKVIDYPIVQSMDNDYYLNHLPDGSESKVGSIFVDYRNEGFNNRHIIVYGHNMKDGSMFSSIKKYQQQEYANEHRYIYVANSDGSTRVFYIYSCHLTDSKGETDGFSAYQVSFEDEEWKKWLQDTQSKSLITSEIEIPEKCNILTLSTCMSRGIETERCVIHAVEISNQKLVEIE